MNVTVKLYQNFSDPFVVNKKKTLIATCTCQITDSVDVDELTLLLDMNADLNKCNYCTIDSFSRSYFCSPGVVNGNQMTMRCESDPLSSFWSTMSNSTCIAERSTSHQNPELVDELLPFKNKPVMSIRSIGESFQPSSSGGCYILTLGGK